MTVMIRILAPCLAFLIALPVSADVWPGPEALSGADVVILGEVHDNPAHHLWQAEVLRAFGPAAVVFEMLTPDQAARISPDLLAEPERLATALEWDASGWPDFGFYRPVFEALGDTAVYGAALPYGEVRAAVEEGAAARFAGDAALYALDRPLSGEVQALREALQAEAHCDALPAALLPGMVEAQRLRDAAFAQWVLEALAETGGPVVLITGNGHARTDWAVPAMIALAAPQVRVVSVGQLEDVAGEDPPFDYWRVTDPAPRDDPCAAFR